MYKGRILIVDDDLDVTKTFKIGLESYGFEVDTYNDPKLALSKFKPGLYDLMIADIRMPNMTGFELCEWIRKRDSFIRICFVTAFEAYYAALSEIYKNMDCRCFIRKPVMIDDLVNHIEQELRK